MKRILTATLALAAMVPAFAEDLSGEKVYNYTCIVCHGNGLLHAPPKGDKQRWAKLIKEGLDEIVPAALHGERAMPPKGNNPNLSDMEVARAVVYMANAGGGKFAEPTAADVVRWREKADAKRLKHEKHRKHDGREKYEKLEKK